MRQFLVSIVVGLVSLVAVLPFSASGQQFTQLAGTSNQPAPAVASQPAASSGAYSGYGAYAPTSFITEHQLEQESLALARQISQITDRDQKSKLQAQLSEVLQKQFEAQQKRRQTEIDAIEARLKKLRELMQKRNDAKKTIIDRRMDQLLQDAEGLGWSTISGQPGWGMVNEFAIPRGMPTQPARR